jgi:hypothetical protein
MQEFNDTTVKESLLLVRRDFVTASDVVLDCR